MSSSSGRGHSGLGRPIPDAAAAPVGDLGATASADRLPRDGSLILTHDNRAGSDGVGAQLQGIYGTYAVARHLGLPYFHSPLVEIRYRRPSGWDVDFDPGLPRRLESVFRIESDLDPGEDCARVPVPDLTFGGLAALAARVDVGTTGGKPILVEAARPFGIADRVPDCYEACKAISPFEAPPRDGRSLRVGLHVGAGNLITKSAEPRPPNAYYLGVARAVSDLLDGLGLEYEIELQAEVPRSDDLLGQARAGAVPQYEMPFVVTPELYEKVYRLDQFDELPNLARCPDMAVIDAIERLATADILITSRSPSSYLAAILNKRGAVLFHPFWHSPMSSWITVARDGTFDLARLRDWVVALD